MTKLVPRTANPVSSRPCPRLSLPFEKTLPFVAALMAKSARDRPWPSPPIVEPAHSQTHPRTLPAKTESSRGHALGPRAAPRAESACGRPWPSPSTSELVSGRTRSAHRRSHPPPSPSRPIRPTFAPVAKSTNDCPWPSPLGCLAYFLSRHASSRTKTRHSVWANDQRQALKLHCGIC